MIHTTFGLCRGR